MKYNKQSQKYILNFGKLTYRFALSISNLKCIFKLMKSQYKVEKKTIILYRIMVYCNHSIGLCIFCTDRKKMSQGWKNLIAADDLKQIFAYNCEGTEQLYIVTIQQACVPDQRRRNMVETE